MRIQPHLAEAIDELIEILRKEKGMTKSSLVDFACLERRYLRGIEQTIQKPTVNAIYSICETLQGPPLEFFQRVTSEIEKLKGECDGKSK